MESATSFRKMNKITRVLQAGTLFILVLLTPTQLFHKEIIHDNKTIQVVDLLHHFTFNHGANS
jgi:hypothetical protein